MVGTVSSLSTGTHGVFFRSPNAFVLYDYPGASTTTFDGINNDASKVPVYGGHQGSHAAMISGRTHTGGGFDVMRPTGPSIDQLVADKIGGATRIKHLATGTVPAGSGNGNRHCSSGVSLIYARARRRSCVASRWRSSDSTGERAIRRASLIFRARPGLTSRCRWKICLWTNYGKRRLSTAG